MTKPRMVMDEATKCVDCCVVRPTSGVEVADVEAEQRVDAVGAHEGKPAWSQLAEG